MTSTTPKTCFITACDKPVNHRGKYCEHHDKKEREAAAELRAMFARMDDKKKGKP